MYSSLKKPKKVTLLNKTMNTVILILIGMTTMMLYSQYNGINTPINPSDKELSPSLWIKGAVGAIILSLIVTSHPESRHPWPMFLAALLGFCLGVLVHFKTSTIDLLKQSLDNVSMLGKIVFVIIVFIGFISLIQTYSTLSTSVTVIVLLCMFVFMFIFICMHLYKLTYNNSWFSKLFRKNSLLRFIYYLVFAIPCIVSFVFDGFLSDFGTAPSYVLQILLVEIIILLLYILIPFIIKMLYIHNPVGANTERFHHLKKHMDALKTSISEQMKEINRIKKPIAADFDWDNHASESKEYIQREVEDLGHGEEDNNTDKGSDVKWYKGNSKCSAETAAAYIKFNAPILKKIKKNLFRTEQEYNDYKYQYDNFNKIYNTIQLINKPVYTDKVTTNDDWFYANFNSEIKSDDDIIPTFKANYVYALSCWVYIHQNGSNSNFRHNEYANIISYGDKPKISYKQSTDTFKIEVQHRKHDTIDDEDNNDDSPTKRIYKTTDLPLQKWNYIVINFHGGTLDVFINNKLVATDGNVIPFISSDGITIGEKGGVSGGLCNLVYYPSTLSKMKINMFYNTLKIKNPPIL